jgi:hypothetical protein
MDWFDRSRTLLSRLPIKDREHHGNVRFNLNPNQLKLHEVCKRQWATEGKLRVIILKARRVGMSSYIEGLLWCYCLAFGNKTCKIIAHLAGAADELFRVPTDLSKAFPTFPDSDIQAKRLMFRHTDGTSTISLATAGTPAVGRGGTPSACHFSESAFYEDEDTFTSLITSTSKGPGSCIFIESTANGREGPGAAFAEYWDNAVAGRNGYIPIFLSWLEDPACVRPAEEAKDAPRDDLERELMAAPFNATLQQIAWMRRTKADDCRDMESTWLQEYPHCPEVAFQVTGLPAFMRNELAHAQKTIKPPLLRARLERDGLKPKLVKDDNGPLHIWKLPFNISGRSDGLRYYIGADAALGMSDDMRTNEGDFAAYVGVCGETGELAFRYAERIPPETLADQLDLAGRYWNIAMVNPELTGNLGRWTLMKLRDVYRYPKIYSWKGRDDKKAFKNKSNALGFDMNNVTRAQILDAARSGLRAGMNGMAGALYVHDRALMAQMSLMTIKEWRWDVARGHDDILVAWMIACLTRAQYPPPRYLPVATKNVMDNGTPAEQAAQLGVPVKTEVSEMELTFRAEMRREMAAAGVRRDLKRGGMRGVGQRSLNRLAGI